MLDPQPGPSGISSRRRISHKDTSQVIARQGLSKFGMIVMANNDLTRGGLMKHPKDVILTKRDSDLQDLLSQLPKQLISSRDLF